MTDINTQETDYSVYDRAKPKSFKLVFVASPISMQH